MSRVLNDVGALDGILGSTLLSLVTALCTMTASLVFMFFLSWQLSLVTLVVFPFVALFLRLGSRPIYMRQKAVQERFGLITAQIQEILGVSGMLLVKSFGRQRYERDRFTEANDELLENGSHLGDGRSMDLDGTLHRLASWSYRPRPRRDHTRGRPFHFSGDADRLRHHRGSRVLECVDQDLGWPHHDYRLIADVDPDL